MIKLFNSFSLKKEDFEPFDKKRVKIFICGPTLYDYTHLGHARIFLTYDLLCRYLKGKNYAIDVLVNMTDINQSVFNKALDQGTDYFTLTRFYSGEFVKDLSLLNITSITRLAHVSDYVKNILQNISSLVKTKNAYSANGNIYFDTKTAKGYGKISKQTREQLNLHRMDIGPNKKNPEDFMLWNCSEDFGFSWKGDFGNGIPWWHIQDTAVAFENFGSHYDIHGGAKELAYPHHEAHLAQYQALTGMENSVQRWMYVGLVLVEGEKMSKSLGNMVLARNLVEKYGQNLLRLYLFSTHYREDLNYKEEDLVAKKKFLEKIYKVYNKTSDKTSADVSKLINEFLDALEDDLNSPKALQIFERICDVVLQSSNISTLDFEKISGTIGLSV
ncbi:MAG TPA: class I tRNA ligase family protein [Nitrosopumilaceae archaeon]|nr:class I tRNA ligase family protein [Nitrosopumilaceae archaeon]